MLARLMDAHDPPRLRTIRRLLLGVLTIGMLGAAAELYLLGHYEDPWQWSPFAMMGAGLIVILWRAIAPGPVGLRAFRIVMLLFIISGGVGSWLHYRGNAEFEVELSPGMSGFDLFRESMSGAFPVLAPGTMSLLGLIGLVQTFGQAPQRRQTSDGASR